MKKEAEIDNTSGILNPHLEDIRVQLINFRQEPVTVHANEQIEVHAPY